MNNVYPIGVIASQFDTIELVDIKVFIAKSGKIKRNENPYHEYGCIHGSINDVIDMIPDNIALTYKCRIRASMKTKTKIQIDVYLDPCEKDDVLHKDAWVAFSDVPQIIGSEANVKFVKYTAKDLDSFNPYYPIYPGYVFRNFNYRFIKDIITFDRNGIHPIHNITIDDIKDDPVEFDSRNPVSIIYNNYHTKVLIINGKHYIAGREFKYQADGAKIKLTALIDMD